METALPAEAKKAASPLLAALHDTANDLQYDALCLDDELFEVTNIVTRRS